MAEIDLSLPTEPHAISKQAYVLYGTGNPGLSEADLEVLQKALNEIYPDLQQVFHALLALTAFGLYVKQAGDEASMERLMVLVRAQAPHFEPIKHQVADQNAILREQFARLTALDTTPDKTAPRFGAAAPEGSIKAAALMPNPALQRPPARKK
ncbi:MAG: hypothetical protein KC933_24020 [Myxococcales bacterium]|nr:hypothetical protein [Myxococcales bacterium]MCB9646224.1 hypothetical protein [Deltaproteobacteria bacterium]